MLTIGNGRQVRGPARERGVALLMTLGILALLLIVAMSFAYSARTEAMAANTGADLTQARLLTDSGLARIMGFTKTVFDATAPTHPSNCVYPPLAAPLYPMFAFDQIGTSGQYYLISKDPDSTAGTSGAGLSAALSVAGVDPNVYTYITSVETTGCQWQLVRNSSGKLIGRIGYLLLDEGGKIDVNGAMTPNGEPFYDANQNGTFDTGEYYLDLNLDGNWNGRTSSLSTAPATIYLAENAPLATQAQRLGSATEEIVLDNKFFSNLPFSDQALPQVRSRWDSLQQMVDGLSSAGGFTAVDYLAHAAGGFDIEAYTADDGTGVLMDYQRFDLSGTAWATAATAGSRGWDVSTSFDDAAKLDWLSTPKTLFWNTASSPRAPLPAPAAGSSEGGMPHFAAALKSDGSAVMSGAQRHQLLANLVDFCDSDSGTVKATTDYDPATHVATYCGLEKVPYINEVQVRIAYNHLLSASGSGHGPPSLPPGWPHRPGGPPPGFDRIDYRFKYEIGIELVNMYLAASGLSQVYLEWEIVCSATGPADIQSGVVTLSNFGSPYTVDCVDPSGYTVVECTGNPGTPANANPPQTGGYIRKDDAPDISEVTFTVSSIKIRVSNPTGGATLDCADVLQNAISYSNFGPEPTLAPEVWWYCGASANDPRCNTRPEEWQPDPTTFNEDETTVSTLGAVNSGPATYGIAVPAGADTGLGSAPDPATSTAVNRYIANRPIRSLWELGAVHRGDAWSTLRLTVPQASGGDAELLDQVKIGPWAYAPGKVNANSPIAADPTARASCPWVFLVARLETDDTYDLPGAGTTPLWTATGSASPAVLLDTLRGDTDHGGLQSRGELYKLDVLHASLAASDMQKESAIGRLANLLTVRKNLFTVIVVGQSVKDLDTIDPGGGDTSDNVVAYKRVGTTDSFCRILAEQKQVAVLYRDAFHNRCQLLRTEYLDEE